MYLIKIGQIKIFLHVVKLQNFKEKLLFLVTVFAFSKDTNTKYFGDGKIFRRKSPSINVDANDREIKTTETTISTSLSCL
jgi:hypothetical protein